MKELNPLIHSQLRLAILSTLMSIEDADFTLLKERTGATMGNLSTQVSKLSEAGYIVVDKGFRGKRPYTMLRMTEEGRHAFNDYVEILREYIQPSIDDPERLRPGVFYPY